ARPGRAGYTRSDMQGTVQGTEPVRVGDPRWWEAKYARGETGWELGVPPPPLVRRLADAPPPPGRVAVLGCGRGHDARFFARRGYPTWGFDFAPRAIRDARMLAAIEFGRQAATGRGVAPAPLVFEQRDLFELPAVYPAFFDLVWEHTCFDAIEPARRPEYVEVVRRILRPGGRLLALFFPVDVPWQGGPPFPMTQAELRRLFEPAFRFDRTEVPADSVARRRGAEWFVEATLVVPPAAGAAR
ncbi:MAG TPA: methyltransferase domain-containing protein, partial [Thermodesulfobacteriota bacterium]|nr:methyltransferase domain-containing protein [Thermodesulfobacteriota bacterium]